MKSDLKVVFVHTGNRAIEKMLFCKTEKTYKITKGAVKQIHQKISRGRLKPDAIHQDNGRIICKVI